MVHYCVIVYCTMDDVVIGVHTRDTEAINQAKAFAKFGKVGRDLKIAPFLLNDPTTMVGVRVIRITTRKSEIIFTKEFDVGGD